MAYIPVTGNALLNYKKVSLAASDILVLNGTPFTVVAAPSSGKVLVPISALVKLTFGTLSYVAAGVVSLYHSSTPILTFPTFLSSGSNTAVQGLGVSPALTSATAITLSVTVANPSLGDGTVDLYLWYNELTL